MKIRRFLAFIILLLAACAPGAEKAQGWVHLPCSTAVRPAQHQMTCSYQVTGERPFLCEVSGSVINRSSQPVTGVQVRVEYGQGLRGEREFTLSPIGDLAPGEQVEFYSQFGYSERLSRYDIFVECAADAAAALAAAITPTGQATQDAAAALPQTPTRPGGDTTPASGLPGQASATLPPGSTLPGSTLPAGATLPPGSTLLPGSVLPTLPVLANTPTSATPQPTPGPGTPRVTLTPSLTVTPTKPAAAAIYFTVGPVLWKMNPDGTNRQRVAQDLPVTETLYLDSARHKLYMSSYDITEQVREVDLNTPTTPEISLNGPDYGGQGVVADPNTHQLFLGLYDGALYVTDYTNSAQGWNELVPVDSMDTSWGTRGQVQIDTANRQIYFRTGYYGDCTTCRFIYRVNYDGSGLTKLVSTNGGNALALDLTARKMYFSDQPVDGEPKIMRANLDGSGLETVAGVPPTYPFITAMALDPAGQWIYLELHEQEDGFTTGAVARVTMNGQGYANLYEVSGDDPEQLRGSVAVYAP